MYLSSHTCYKNLLFFYVLLGFTSFAKAQSSVDQNIALKEPTPPTEHRFVNYYDQYSKGNIDFTGKIDINVPIYQLQIGSFTLPISLSYNPSLKVESTASWVGFGWELKAGGSISRQINGMPDDIRRTGLNNGNPLSGAVNAYGYLLYGATETEKFHDNAPKYNVTAKLSRIVGNNLVLDNNLNQITEYWDGAYGHKFDTEPDIFYIDAGKMSGSQFIFNKEKKATFLTHRNYQTDYSISSEVQSTFTTKGIRTFRVRDDSGNIYNFGLCDSLASYTDKDGYQDQFKTGNALPFWDGIRATQWYLTEIITNEGERIKFNYQDEMIYSKYYSLKARAFESDSQYGQIEYTHTWARNKTKRLISIETRHERIEFQANHQREDVNSSRALTDINIYSKHNGINSLIKAFKMDYFYFESSDDVVHTIHGSSDFSSDNYGNNQKRLQLYLLQEFDTSLTASLPPYKFFYNDSYSFPGIHSNQKDFWGYFNAKPNGHQFPKLYIYPNAAGYEKYTPFRKLNYGGLEYVMNGADRHADTNAVTAAVLQKIKFPTGGEVQYTFESNEFNWNNSIVKGNGIRIKQIKTLTSSQVTSIKNYRYLKPGTQLTSGVTFDLPQFGFVEKTFDYYSYPNPTGGGTHISPYQMNHSSKDFFKYFLSVNNQPFYYSGIASDAKMGYSHITEEIPGLGKTVLSFSVEGKLGEKEYIIKKNYRDSLGADTILKVITVEPVKIAEGYHYDSFSGIRPNLGIASLDTTSMSPGLFTFPYLRLPNFNWNRGQLMKKAIYSAAGQIMSEEINEYEVFNSNLTDTLAIIPGLVITSPSNYTQAPNDWTDEDNWFWYGKYAMITGISKSLKRSLQRHYVNNSSQFLTNETVYTNNRNNTVRSVMHKTPAKITKTSYVYPFDISTIESNFYDMEPAIMAISELKLRNQISLPVEVYTELLGSNFASKGVTAAKYSQYQVFDGLADPLVSMSTRKPSSLVLPFEIFELNTPGILTNFNRAQYSSSTLDVNINPNYRSQKRFENYIRGGRLETLYQQDKVSKILWDYDGLYPIANIQNTQNADYAYTSFETMAGKGGWDFNNAFNELNNDNPNFQYPEYSTTGTRCYLLGLSIGGITKTNLNPQKKYILSFWYVNGLPQIIANQVTQLSHSITSGFMNYAEYEISNSTSVKVTAFDTDVVLDELKVFPKDAFMVTSTYQPLIGITSSVDEKGNITYYEYDRFQRLKNIKDQKKNILKTYDYNYKP